MKCPVCIEPDLVMSDRQGVEIDYCPHCRGVWLDRGELDKIIERSEQIDRPDDRHREHSGREYSKGYGQKPYKHKSFWRKSLTDPAEETSDQQDFPFSASISAVARAGVVDLHEGRRHGPPLTVGRRHIALQVALSTRRFHGD